MILFVLANSEDPDMHYPLYTSSDKFIVDMDSVCGWKTVRILISWLLIWIYTVLERRITILGTK